MMRLKLWSEPESGSVLVYWSTGSKTKGCVSIQINNTPIGYKVAIAELVVARHLIYQKSIFQRIPNDGTPFELTFSDPKVVNILEGQPETMHVFKYGRFLTPAGRMGGCKIQIQMDQDKDAHDLSIPDTEHLEIDHSNYFNYEIVDTHSMGKVILTEHAVQRFIQKIRGDEVVKKPWDSLIKRMQHTSLREYILSADVQRHKTRKYMGESNTRVFGNPGSTLRFVVITSKDATYPIVATVFRRADSM